MAVWLTLTVTSPTPEPSSTQDLAPTPAATATAPTPISVTTTFSAVVPSPAESQDADISGELVGAVIGVLGGLLVAGVVAPIVATLSRRRERWEDRVAELSTVVDEEIAQALRRYTNAARRVQGSETRMRYAESEFEQRSLASHSEEANQALAQAQRGLSEAMDRLSLLVRRARMIRREAMYWTELQDIASVLRASLIPLFVNWRGKAGSPLEPETSRETFDTDLAVTRARFNDLKEKIGVVDTFALPPISFGARLRAMKKWIMRAVGLREGGSAAGNDHGTTQS